MDNRLDLLHEDVKEIKSHVIELVKQGAVQQSVLIEHERRSTNLEERFKPIESVYIFGAKSAAMVILVGAVIGSVKAIMSLIGR